MTVKTIITETTVETDIIKMTVVKDTTHQEMIAVIYLYLWLAI